MADELKWYVAHTYSGYENTVAVSIQQAVENRNMHDLIAEVSIPLETVTEITDNGPKTVERKVFPGYVLVKMIMTDETWHLVRNIRGVTGFVGSGNKAIPLTEEEIAALGVEKREVVVGYAVGDSVKITDGALASFIMLNFAVFWYFFIKEKKRYSFGNIVKYLICPWLGILILGYVFTGFDVMTYALGVTWFVIGFIICAVKSKGFKEVPDAFKNLDV